MAIAVEPRDGHELDRLITVLLNVTGVVHRMVEEAKEPAHGDGVEVIGRVAGRLRAPLAFLAEHHRDEDLALVTGILAEAALLAAKDAGLDASFGGR